MKDAAQNERLSAYLDQELSPVERTQVDEWLARDAAARQLLEELRALRSALAALPRQPLGEDLTERVLQTAQRRLRSMEDQRPAPAEPALPPLWRTIHWRGMLGRRALVWSGLAVAVAVMLRLSEPRLPERKAAPQLALAPVTQPAEKSGREAPSIHARPTEISAPPAAGELAAKSTVADSPVSKKMEEKRAANGASAHDVDREGRDGLRDMQRAAVAAKPAGSLPAAPPSSAPLAAAPPAPMGAPSPAPAANRSADSKLADFMPARKDARLPTPPAKRAIVLKGEPAKASDEIAPAEKAAADQSGLADAERAAAKSSAVDKSKADDRGGALGGMQNMGGDNSPLKKGATAGLPSSASARAEKNTAGQASSGTHNPDTRLFQQAANGYAGATNATTAQNSQAPASPAAVGLAGATRENLIVVDCEVSHEAADTRNFEQVLALNGIRWDRGRSNQNRAQQSWALENRARNGTANDATQTVQGASPPAELVLIEATPAQLAATLGQLRARPTAFPLVSVRPAPGVEAQENVGQILRRRAEQSPVANLALSPRFSGGGTLVNGMPQNQVQQNVAGGQNLVLERTTTNANAAPASPQPSAAEAKALNAAGQVDLQGADWRGAGGGQGSGGPASGGRMTQQVQAGAAYSSSSQTEAPAQRQQAMPRCRVLFVLHTVAVSPPADASQRQTGKAAEPAAKAKP